MLLPRFRHTWHVTKRDRVEAIIARSPCKSEASGNLFALSHCDHPSWSLWTQVGFPALQAFEASLGGETDMDQERPIKVVRSPER